MIPKNKNTSCIIEEYASYTFDDFLFDDFFINSLKNPSYESVKFWDQYISSNPLNIEAYYQAKSYIESLYKGSDYLSDKETFEMWKNIEIANKKELQIGYRQKRIRLWSVVAGIAIIVAVFLSYPFLSDREESFSLMSFVEKTAEVSGSSDQTQLILSNKEVINLSEQESEISYKEGTIEINKKDGTHIVQEQGETTFNQIIVPKGKRVTLNLADGTKLWINSGTKVIYPAKFNKDKREIYVDGEVLAEVKKEKKHPFLIQTPKLGVEVLGTTFNVNAYSTDISHSVILVSGSVKVLSEKKEVLLKPNERYENNQETISVETVDVEKYISWIKGIYIYESERLDTIMKQISRYYGIEIICDNQAASLHFSGKLDMKDDIALILTGIERTSPVTVKKDNGKYIITLKK